MIARGQAAIPRTDAAAEGMYGGVEPAGLEVEADGSRGSLPEEMLAIDGVFARPKVLARLFARRTDGGDQRDQFAAQLGEDARDLGRHGAGFVFVQQGVVRRFLVIDRLRLLALQGHDFVEPRRERRKMTVLARLGPDV